MEIMDLMLHEVSKRLAELDIRLHVNAAAKDWLMEKGYDVAYGARPLRRTIQKEIEDPLSMAILQGRFEAGDTVSAEERSGKISFRRKNRRKKRAVEEAPAAELTASTDEAVKLPAKTGEKSAGSR